MAETFQDRLVTELRLADARTMDQATAVLRDFLPRCNARFAVQPEHPEAAYRPVASDRCLSETLCFKHTRKVGRDNTVKHHWRVLQLLPDRERPSYAGLRVEVLEENWPNIRQALMETVELVDTFGFDSRTIQATNSLLPIAYYLYKKGAPRDFETSDHFLQDRAVIRGWLTRSILKESGIWGSGLDTLLTALREVIRNSNDVEFPAADLRRIMPQRGKTLDFVEEEIEELADMRLGDRRIFPMLTMLFPYLDSRDGSDIDHVFPKSRFAPTRLKAAQVDEELFDEFRDRSERLANLQLLDRTVNNEKRATLPSDWLGVHCLSPEAHKIYCDRHQFGDVPEQITGFMDFYSQRRARLLARIAGLVNTV